jgi:DNA-binding NarL/FixJ family response regulator
VFSERELEVLRLLARGHSNPEIARQLYLAPGTVRNYVSVILQKLGVPDRTQAAVAAVRLGLVDGADARGPLPAGDAAE